MRSLTDIRSANWQISLNGYGYVEDGFDDINQCIEIILTTRKGSVPFKPLFGCDIFQYMDQPINIAAPKMVQAIIEAVSIWEPRIVINEVNYSVAANKEYNLVFNILWTLKKSGQSGNLEFNLLRSFAEPPLIRPVPVTGNLILADENSDYIVTEQGDFILI